MLKKIVVAGAIILTTYTFVLAATSSTIVPIGSLKSTSITIRVNGHSIKKLIYCLGKTPGTAKVVPGAMSFTPFASILRDYKAKRISGTKLTTNTQLNSVGKRACVKLDILPIPTQTPIPLPPGNFDSAGNLTDKGKVTFGVASTLTGNISEGKALSNSYCSCHGERLGAKFPEVRNAIFQPPMFFDSNQITDPMLANIIAYLNRFQF